MCTNQVIGFTLSMDLVDEIENEKSKGLSRVCLVLLYLLK